MAENQLYTPQLREAFFLELYKKAFYTVARYVALRGGSYDEAQDVFQDALVIYYEMISRGNHEIITNEKAYVTGIAKKLWLQHLRSAGRNELPDDSGTGAEPDAQVSENKVLAYIETAGKKCMELLRAYYYDKVPVQKVVELFGYSGIRSATVAKYKCLEKVRETVKQKSLQYADFTE